MRAALGLACVLLAGCSATSAVDRAARNPDATSWRTLPPSSLVARAWSGREPPPTARAWAVVQFAYARIGMQYCWGGTGPVCFDCSGFVQRAWGSVGVRVPRTTGEIASELPEVPLDQVRAGDILWWPGHVGLYAGSGWVVDALDHRHGVVRRPAADPYRAFRPAAEPAAEVLTRYDAPRSAW